MGMCFFNFYLLLILLKNSAQQDKVGFCYSE